MTTHSDNFVDITGSTPRLTLIDTDTTQPDYRLVNGGTDLKIRYGEPSIGTGWTDGTEIAAFRKDVFIKFTTNSFEVNGDATLKDHATVIGNLTVGQAGLTSQLVCNHHITAVDQLAVNTESGSSPDPPVLVVEDVGSPPEKYYLWVGSDGKLRIQAGTRPNNAGELGGTVVGSQS